VTLPRGPALRLQRLEILREKTLRKAVDRHGGLSVFSRLFWPLVKGVELKWSRHHQWMCDEMEGVGRNEVPNLVICVPPRSLKTTLAGVMFPGWHWLAHPEESFFNATRVTDLAEDSSRYCRDLTLQPLYQELRELAAKRLGTPMWGLDPSQSKKVAFETTAAGMYRALGVGVKAIGKGAHIQIVDDLLDPFEIRDATPERRLEICDTAQAYVWEYLATRFNDPSSERRIMTAHRVCEDDPPGRALREGWRAVVLPMRGDPDRPTRYHRDDRKHGELLHPERVNETKAAEYEKGFGEFGPALLDQNPMPGKGGLLDAAWLEQHYDEDPEDIARTCDELVISADAAKKPTGSSDFHGLQVWGKRGSRKYLLDYATARMGYPEFEREMDRLIRRWAPVLRGRVVALIEDTANGTTYLQVRSQAWIPAVEVAPGKWEVAPEIALIPFHPSRDTPGDDKSKPARFLYFVRSAEAREVWTPKPTRFPWVTTWRAAVIGFPKTAHDDDADATSQCFVRWATEPSPAKALASWAKAMETVGRRRI